MLRSLLFFVAVVGMCGLHVVAQPHSNDGHSSDTAVADSRVLLSISQTWSEVTAYASTLQWLEALGDIVVVTVAGPMRIGKSRICNALRETAGRNCSGVDDGVAVDAPFSVDNSTSPHTLSVNVRVLVPSHCSPNNATILILGECTLHI